MVAVALNMSQMTTASISSVFLLFRFKQWSVTLSVQYDYPSMLEMHVCCFNIYFFATYNTNNHLLHIGNLCKEQGEPKSYQASPNDRF
jgi:hypothetical protein